MVGYLPLTIAVTYLGSRAETLSLSNPLVWVAVAVPVGLLSSEWFLRHRRRRKETDAGPVEPADSGPPPDRESTPEPEAHPEQAVQPDCCLGPCEP